jgi:hypothetical protein
LEDGTLIKTKSGKVFPVDSADWQFWSRNVVAKLRKCHEQQQYKLIIFTNQMGIEVICCFGIWGFVHFDSNNSSEKARRHRRIQAESAEHLHGHRIAHPSIQVTMIILKIDNCL